MKITLKEFFINGALGAITFGMSYEAVLKILGDPESKTPTKAKPVIWKYADLQLTFERGVVDFIGVYFRDERLPDAISFEGFFPSKETTLESFKEYVRSEGLTCSIDNDLTFDSQLCLVIGVGISVYFDTISNRIDSMQYANIKQYKRDLRPCV